MARVIDADALLNEAEYDSNFRLIIPADKVKNAPTLTPPNEALICDGCLWAEMGALEKCSSCMRDKKIITTAARRRERHERKYSSFI